MRSLDYLIIPTHQIGLTRYFVISFSQIHALLTRFWNLKGIDSRDLELLVIIPKPTMEEFSANIPDSIRNGAEMSTLPVLLRQKTSGLIWVFAIGYLSLSFLWSHQPLEMSDFEIISIDRLVSCGAGFLWHWGGNNRYLINHPWTKCQVSKNSEFVKKPFGKGSINSEEIKTNN
jgi:hypothetical protein